MIRNKWQGYNPDGTRLLFKGGDGGAGQLRDDEAARQQKVQAAVDAINGQFKQAGTAQYDDLGNAVTGVAKNDLDRQFKAANNNNIFGLARSGLLGGSVDAESGADLATRYGEGQIKAEQAGQGAASDLQSTDERTRQNLIGLAQSGIDTGTAASLAASQTASAAQAAKSAIPSATVGDMFSDLGQAYLMNTQNRARYPNGLPQQANAGPSFGNLFTGKNYAGTVTN